MSYFQAYHEAKAQLYMDRREAAPESLAACPRCTTPLDDFAPPMQTLFRCEDCHHVDHQCATCILTAHHDRPFDRLWRWSIELGFWEKQTLADVGYVWHVGHGNGGVCEINASPSRPITILHEHGIMELPVKFCQCLGADPEPAQLLKHGCWPATWKTPSTAITLNTMRTYHGLELQGQLNVHDYIAHLRRMTDGVTPDRVKDRYREFNNSMREFRQVRARRRHGVPLDARPRKAELAVLCPACPQPHINMRPGWKDRKPAYRYLDALHYSIDGNFHLGSNAKPTDPDDFALSEGAAYFVSVKDFQTYLKKSPEPEKEVSWIDAQQLLL
ncbi:hypothetical protein OH77DRAFT_1465830 [Trametes cingulata]|nr:hypothetical protein OH77DRAFT_1465830 [Trametes cingulata]